MAPTTPPVLITGINGYIGGVATRAFLSAGHPVRGTVRSLAKYRPALEAAFGSDIASGALQLVEVPDSNAPGAWDGVVAGVGAIASVASPDIESLAGSPAEVMAAAKSAMTALLASADTHAGPQLKSVVLISSLAALMPNEQDPTHVYTDEDFSPALEQLVLSFGPDAHPGIVYSGVKAAIEAAFWTFVEDPARTTDWVGATVLPGYCIGPGAVRPPNGPQGLTMSTRHLWVIFAGREWEPDKPMGVYVDVRDVARALVYCVEKPDDAAGERFLVAKWKGNNQAAADILRKAFPDRKGVIAEGEPGKDVADGYMFRQDETRFDGSKIEEAGLVYTPFEQSVIDSAKWYVPWLEQ